MRHFSKEQLRRARRTDLYAFLMRVHPDLFRRDGSSIHPRDNCSLSIKRGYSGYVDFATDEKGNSVDFLTKHLGYQLDDAVFALCGGEGNLAGSTVSVSTFAVSQAPPKSKMSEKLPPQFPDPIDATYKQLYAYLMSRGISAATIKMLIDRKILYQDSHNNIVFANKERDWGERRGTNTYADARCVHRSVCPDFKSDEHGWCSAMHTCAKYKKDSFRGMIANSRDDGFWWFQVGGHPADKVYVCEASIDAISLYELHRLDGIAENAVYVSIGGTSKQLAIDRLKQHKRVILAVDNDAAGSVCRKRNAGLECIIPTHKDWNDDLQARK